MSVKNKGGMGYQQDLKETRIKQQQNSTKSNKLYLLKSKLMLSACLP